jgi:hypothetical protein
MKATIFRQAVLGGAFVVLLSGCVRLDASKLPADDNSSLPSGQPLPGATSPVSTTSSQPAQPAGDSSVATTNQAVKTAPPKVSAHSDTTLATSSGDAVAVKPPDASADDTGSSFDNLELVDAGLSRKLAVLRVGSDRTASNLLSIYAGLKNKTGHVLEIEAQTIYKDKSDTALNDGKGSWIPMQLKAREQTEYRSVSLSPDAVDFMVRIRLKPTQ